MSKKTEIRAEDCMAVLDIHSESDLLKFFSPSEPLPAASQSFKSGGEMNVETGRLQQDEEERAASIDKDEFKETKELMQEPEELGALGVNKWMASLIRSFSKRTKERDLYGLFIYSLYSLFLNSSKEVYPKDEEEMCEDKILNGVILLKIVINYQKDPNKLEKTMKQHSKSRNSDSNVLNSNKHENPFETFGFDSQDSADFDHIYDNCEELKHFSKKPKSYEQIMSNLQTYSSCIEKIIGTKPDTLKVLEDTYSNISKSTSVIPKDVTFNDPQNNIQSSLNISFVVIDHLYEIFQILSNCRKDKKGSISKARIVQNIETSSSIFKDNQNIKFIEDMSKMIQEKPPKDSPKSSKSKINTEKSNLSSKKKIKKAHSPRKTQHYSNKLTKTKETQTEFNNKKVNPSTRHKTFKFEKEIKLSDILDIQLIKEEPSQNSTAQIQYPPSPSNEVEIALPQQYVQEIVPIIPQPISSFPPNPEISVALPPAPSLSEFGIQTDPQVPAVQPHSELGVQTDPPAPSAPPAPIIETSEISTWTIPVEVQSSWSQVDQVEVSSVNVQTSPQIPPPMPIPTIYASTQTDSIPDVIPKDIISEVIAEVSPQLPEPSQAPLPSVSEAELAELKEQHSAEKARLASSHEREIQQLKEEFDLKYAEMRAEYEIKIESVNKEMNEKLREKEENEKRLKSKMGDNMFKTKKAEREVSDLNKQIDTIRQQNVELQAELQKAKNECNSVADERDRLREQQLVFEKTKSTAIPEFKSLDDEDIIGSEENKEEVKHSHDTDELVKSSSDIVDSRFVSKIPVIKQSTKLRNIEKDELKFDIIDHDTKEHDKHNDDHSSDGDKLFHSDKKDNKNEEDDFQNTDEDNSDKDSGSD